MNTIQFLQSVADWLLADPSHIIVAASALAAVTPTPNPTSPAGKLYKVLDLLALNFLKAKETGVTVPTALEQVAAIIEASKPKA